MAKILLIEDDKTLSGMIFDWLKLENHVVDAVDNGLEAFDRIRYYEYDAAIVDWDLPGKSGIDICKEYRAGGGMMRVLMLTGKGKIDEKEQGLDAGADDYLTKPFDMKELSARLRALLRRPHVAQHNVLRAGDIELDTITHKVTKSGAAVELVPKEFQLLEFFMRHPNQIFSSEALLNRVWSSESDATVEALKSCLKRLRKKIDSEDGQSILKNIHGVGYKLES